MTKSELIAEMASAAGITKAQADAAYGALVKAVESSVKTGAELRLTDIGTLRVVERKARDGKNPKTGEKLRIEASKSVGFRAASNLKKLANGGM